MRVIEIYLRRGFIVCDFYSKHYGYFCILEVEDGEDGDGEDDDKGGGHYDRGFEGFICFIDIVGGIDACFVGKFVPGVGSREEFEVRFLGDCRFISGAGLGAILNVYHGRVITYSCSQFCTILIFF